MTKMPGGGGSTKRSASQTAPPTIASTGTAMGSTSRSWESANLDRIENPLMWPSASSAGEHGRGRATAGASRARERPLHELRPQRLAPVGDGRDFLLFEQDLGVLLHIRPQVRRKAGA